MKTKKRVLFIAVLMVSAAFQTVWAGAENRQTRNVKNFHAVDVSSGIDLFLKMGETEEVRVEADDDEIEDIKTEVKNGTLHIYFEGKSFFNLFNFNSHGARKVYVTVKELSEIEASSGSDVRSENTLEGEALEVKASSGANANLTVVYKNVSLDASSGADIKVSGKAKMVRADSSSGSDINARDLVAAVCRASASSGSDVIVHATEEISGNASSGGDITYYGNPKTKNIEESSGGDVSGR